MFFSGFSLFQTSHKTILPANLDILSPHLCLVPISICEPLPTCISLALQALCISFTVKPLNTSASIMATSSGKLTCYGTNGAVESGAIPCDSQAKISTCCPYTDICYSNGLCAIGPGQPTNGGQTPYYTGFCTDRTWSNGTTCPSICNNQPGGEFRHSTCALISRYSGFCDHE